MKRSHKTLFLFILFTIILFAVLPTTSQAFTSHSTSYSYSIKESILGPVQDMIDWLWGQILRIPVHIIDLVAAIPESVFNFIGSQIEFAESVILNVLGDSILAAVALPIAMVVVMMGYLIIIYFVIWVISDVIPFL